MSLMSPLDSRIRQYIIDYFDPIELVEFLGVSVEVLVDSLDSVIEENLEDIIEEMGLIALEADNDDD